MLPMSASEIKEKYIKFFESKGHKAYNSFSLLPEDKSILFTIAGMVPFKQIFLGREKAISKRAVSAQRCIRTSDIDIIGTTARHLTFFEMLGNFSFGDYFKEKAIEMGWCFVKNILKIPEDRVIITIYKDDNEAFEIWSKLINIDQIKRLGKDSNFWYSGQEGPCGPCSEIYYAFDGLESFDPDSPRFIEIYNMVFMEFNKVNNTIEELPNKNIDTGMGLERVAYVLQNVNSVFEIDSIKPIINYLNEISKNSNDKALKIISDHIRAICYLIYDGVRPSNEKQGYVLRKLIRRSVRYGLEIGLKNFMVSLADNYINSVKELKISKDIIKSVINKEEIKFNETLDIGLDFAKSAIERSENGILNSQTVFQLYDTYGFPFELTSELANQSGVKVDYKEFEKRFEEHKEKSKNNSDFKSYKIEDTRIKEILELYGESNFVGYDLLEIESQIISVYEENDELKFIFDKTPFYAESGGQIGDKGVIICQNHIFEVLDVQKISEIYVHTSRIKKDIDYKTLEGIKCHLKVDNRFRNLIKSNHTATHLLHSAAKKVLGLAEQAGSLVTDSRLRLDLRTDSNISVEDIIEIENLVNDQILSQIKVNISSKHIDDAVKSGAIAYFDNKYGEEVRVVDVPGFSMELCGGTHVSNTSEIGVFKILSCKAISSNVKRIEAITNLGVLDLLNESLKNIDKISEVLRVPKDNIIDKVKKNALELEHFKKYSKDLSIDFINYAIDQKISSNNFYSNGYKIITLDIDVEYFGNINLDFKNTIVIIKMRNNMLSIIVSEDVDVDAGKILSISAKKISKKGGGSKKNCVIKLDNFNDLNLIREDILKSLGVK
jgi:alanyl-tRNA synthetase